MHNEALKSHNLYIEVSQELGLIGLIIFLAFMRTAFLTYSSAAKCAFAHRDGFLKVLSGAMGAWLVAQLMYSLVSYGLSGFGWYLFAGLSVVLKKLCEVPSAEIEALGLHPLRAQCVSEQ